MSRLVVWAVDRPGNDPKAHGGQQWLKGDVIDVLPDGLDPGVMVHQHVKNGLWAIVDVPDMSKSDASRLLVPQPRTRSDQTVTQLWRRAFTVKVDLLPTDHATTKQAVDAATEQKADFVDPSVIGDDPAVIG